MGTQPEISPNTRMMQRLKIEIDLGHLAPLTQAEIERVHETIRTLVQRDVLFMKNGRAVLHFDRTGDLQEIEFNYKRWRRGTKL